jgi:hypothetical protein
LGIVLIITIAFFSLTSCAEDTDDNGDSNGGGTPPPPPPPEAHLPFNNELPYILQNRLLINEVIDGVVQEVDYGTLSFLGNVSSNIVIVNPANGNSIDINSHSFILSAGMMTPPMDPIQYPAGYQNEVVFEVVSPLSLSGMLPGTTNNFLQIRPKHPNRTNSASMAFFGTGTGNIHGDFLEARSHIGQFVITYDMPDGDGGFMLDADGKEIENYSMLPQVQNQVGNPNIRVEFVVRRVNPLGYRPSDGTNRIIDPAPTAPTNNTRGSSPYSITINLATFGSAADSNLSTIDGFPFELEYTIVSAEWLYRNYSTPDERTAFFLMPAGPPLATAAAVLPQWRTIPDTSVTSIPVWARTGSGAALSHMQVAVTSTNTTAEFANLAPGVNYYIVARIKDSHNYLPAIVGTVREGSLGAIPTNY